MSEKQNGKVRLTGQLKLYMELPAVMAFLLAALNIWIYRLDSLTRTEDGWKARFTQEPMGNWAAEFTATDLTGHWQYGGRVHIQS